MAFHLRAARAWESGARAPFAIIVSCCATVSCLLFALLLVKNIKEKKEIQTNAELILVKEPLVKHW